MVNYPCGLSSISALCRDTCLCEKWEQSEASGLIDDLVEFIGRDDVPVFAHASLAHAQLETIHPFEDGNGRTGRALVHAMLRSKGLTRTVTVPISAGLLVDIDAYFAALTAYRAGTPELIVERFAEAAFAAVANGRALVSDLRGVRAEWQARIRARRGAAAWQVADLLLRQPVVMPAWWPSSLAWHRRTSTACSTRCSTRASWSPRERGGSVSGGHPRS